MGGLEYFSEAGLQCLQAITQETKELNECFNDKNQQSGPTITQEEFCRYITYTSTVIFSATDIFLVLQRPGCGGRVCGGTRVKDLPYKFCLQKFTQGRRAVCEGGLRK